MGKQTVSTFGGSRAGHVGHQILSQNFIDIIANPRKNRSGIHKELELVL